MSGSEGPWSKKPAAHRQSSRLRFFIWLGLLVAGGLGLIALAKLFPSHGSSNLSDAYLVRYVVLLVLLSAGIVSIRQFNFRETARNFAIWIAIAAVLVLGFTYQTELEDVTLRVRSEFVPSYAVETSPSVLTLTASPGGEFIVMGEVNRAPVKFLVDTGATEIVLSPSDAERLGIKTSDLHFSELAQTANGIGRGARYVVDSLSIGPIKLFDVPVSINEADMDTSLLGMAFLKRMKSFEFNGRRLLLRWR